MNKIVLNFNGRLVSETPFSGDAVTIGRGPGNDIVIDNPAISSRHARVFKEKNFIILEDLGSTNGTFVNGEKIRKAVINSRDDITVGKHQLKLSWEEGTGDFEAGSESNPAAVIQSLDKTMVFAKDPGKAGAGKAAVGGFAVMEGGVAKERIPMTDRVTTIGKSSDALIKLKGLLAPKVAALVNRSDRGYVLSSPDAKKPAIINGNKVDKPYVLKNGDVVEIAGITLRFYLKK
ncbi:MAG: FHA domain-containing protein [bacterium]|nr:FHA domain-containing protein [bacterium]